MKNLYLILISLIPFICWGQTTKNYKQTQEGISIPLKQGTLCIYPIADNAVRIKYCNTFESSLQELIFTEKYLNPEFKIFNTTSKLVIKTKRISKYNS